MPGSPWDVDDIKLLRKYYPVHGPEWNGWEELFPQRSYIGIQSCARRNGIRKLSKKSRNRWNDVQRKTLVKGMMLIAEKTGKTTRQCAIEMLRLLSEREIDG